MEWLYKFLDTLSYFSCFLIVFSLLFILQKYSIGLIPGITEITIFGKLYLYELVFSVNSLIIILKYFKFSSPYQNYL